MQVEPNVKNVKTVEKDVFRTMEFTHQNLNKDFLTADQKKNQFADFMSIVD